MDKFLEKGKLSKLNEEEADSLNKPITAGKIAAVIKPLAYKSAGLDIGEFDKTFKGELSPFLLKKFKKIQGDGRLPHPFHEASIILITKTEKDTTEKNYTAIPLMNIDVKYSKKYWQTVPSNTLKRSYIMIKWDSFQGCKGGIIFTNQ